MSKIFKITLASMFVAAFALTTSVHASAPAANFTVDQTIGSKGENVRALQVFLNACPDTALAVPAGAAGSMGYESSTFGPATKMAVMAFQAKTGVNQTGYFGPMSRAKAAMGNDCGTTTTTTTTTTTATTTAGLPAGCTSTSGFSSTTGASCAVATTTLPAGCTSTTGFSTTTGASCAAVVTTLPAGCTSTAGFSSTTGASCSGASTVNNGPLMGTAGEISDVNKLSQYSNEEVGEGEKDVKVMGFEVEASNDGDIELKSVKVSAIITNATGSTRMDDYADEVTVWMGSTKVGSAMVSEFTKNSTGNYSKTVALSNAVVRADKIEKLYVAFTAPSGFDSGDIDSESFTLGLDNVRFIDGSGVVTTESTVGDLPMTTTVSFVSFSTSADTVMKISTDSSNPVAKIVEVDSTDNTDNVVLLKGKIKLEGKSDVTIDTFPITLISTGDSISALTGNVTLMLGDKEYSESTGSNCSASCDLNTTATLIFDNLNYKISANTSSPSTGTTVNFTIKAELNDIEETGLMATDFDAGDALKASVTSTNRDAIDAENAQGDQLNTTSERSGSATGENQTFFADGINVSDFSSTVTSSSNTGGAYTNQTYTVTYKVTAFGNTYYMPKTVARTATTAGTTTQGLIYSLEKSDGTVTPLGTASASSLSSSANTVGGYFEIPDGETKTFTATIGVSSPADTAITGNGTLATLGGYFRIQLESVRYDDDQAGTPTSLSLTPSQNYETADRQIGA